METEDVFMKRSTKEGLCALLAGFFLMSAAAFVPAPRAAWWCAAFSVMCDEAVQEDSGTPPVFRLRLVEWWQALMQDK